MSHCVDLIKFNVRDPNESHMTRKHAKTGCTPYTLLSEGFPYVRGPWPY